MDWFTSWLVRHPFSRAFCFRSCLLSPICRISLCCMALDNWLSNFFSWRFDKSKSSAEKARVVWLDTVDRLPLGVIFVEEYTLRNVSWCPFSPLVFAPSEWGKPHPTTKATALGDSFFYRNWLSLLLLSVGYNSCFFIKNFSLLVLKKNNFFIIRIPRSGPSRVNKFYNFMLPFFLAESIFWYHFFGRAWQK